MRIFAVKSFAARVVGEVHESAAESGQCKILNSGRINDSRYMLCAQSVLDYGCGKGTLAEAVSFEIREYDPAIAGKDENPLPADLVICTDALEHIEPEYLDAVLVHIASLTRMAAFFVVHTGRAQKN